ncbi:hypothetical protein [Kibdelosporangium aridum]|uniref:hypothetical protein n=1 Tax=Kibdelosporangium aridum TaxID=2030 RepID=UPI0035EF0EDA
MKGSSGGDDDHVVDRYVDPASSLRRVAVDHDSVHDVRQCGDPTRVLANVEVLGQVAPA